MPDQIDDLMTEHLPDIKQAVENGLKVTPALEDYLPVEVVTSSLPYRMTSVHWLPRAFSPRTRAWGQLMCKRSVCVPEFEGAIELAVTTEITFDYLRDDRDGVLARARELARKARLYERRSVLEVLCNNAMSTIPYTIESIEERSEELGGSARLLATLARDEIADSAATAGMVENVVNSVSELPAGVHALLIATLDGPVVRRVVDDLTPTWRRQADGISLCISERLYVDCPGRSAKFR